MFKQYLWGFGRDSIVKLWLVHGMSNYHYARCTNNEIWEKCAMLCAHRNHCTDSNVLHFVRRRSLILSERKPWDYGTILEFIAFNVSMRQRWYCAKSKYLWFIRWNMIIIKFSLLVQLSLELSFHRFRPVYIVH